MAPGGIQTRRIKALDARAINILTQHRLKAARAHEVLYIAEVIMGRICGIHVPLNLRAQDFSDSMNVGGFCGCR